MSPGLLLFMNTYLKSWEPFFQSDLASRFAEFKGDFHEFGILDHNHLQGRNLD